jgi:hypothetical protein
MGKARMLKLSIETHQEHSHSNRVSPEGIVGLIVSRFSEPKACGCLCFEVGDIHRVKDCCLGTLYLGKLCDIAFAIKLSVHLSRTICKG